MSSSWHDRLIDDPPAIGRLLAATRRIAVLGIKPEAASHQPAFYVPSYLADAGFDVIPVPRYYPDTEQILGRPVFRSLADIPGRIDLIAVFQRPDTLSAHLDEFLAARPYAVWFQSGIRNDAVAEALARAGIQVVQDRCLMVEHRRLAG